MINCLTDSASLNSDSLPSLGSLDRYHVTCRSGRCRWRAARSTAQLAVSTVSPCPQRRPTSAVWTPAAPPTLGLRVTVTARTAAGDGDGGGGGGGGDGGGDGDGGGGGGGGDGDIAEPGECLKGTRLGGGRQPDSVWSGICPPQTPLPQPRTTSRTVNRTRESRLDPQELIH